ncbi:hypothetical protein JW935_15840 [candidate division KSB1 bacterium]|nr:hypothetical protein [candidate division KSB1 bacterium]
MNDYFTGLTILIFTAAMLYITRRILTVRIVFPPQEGGKEEEPLRFEPEEPARTKKPAPPAQNGKEFLAS